MKVCSLYGAGFYYIPGTDTCIKIGGFLRTEFNIHSSGSFATFVNGGNALQTRTEDNYVTRARGVITLDTREQTSYGTLRSYIAGGWQYSTDDAPTLSLPGAQALPSSASNTFAGSSANGNAYLLRAFIQWGGFTFGKTASFFDFFNTSKYSHQTNILYQDFGGVGIFTYGYTQQLGNGMAFTFALQDPSPFVRPINQLGGSLDFLDFTTAGAQNSNSSTAGTLVPDLVAALRVDQAWGGAQVAAIAHDNRATYYTNAPGGAIGPGTIAGSGHPGDKWGVAVMGGLELNLATWGWAKGDTLAVQSQYCVGASYGCYNTGGTRLADVGFSLYNPNRIGIGWVTDAYFTGLLGQDNSLQLSTSWNIIAAIQHYWTPDVRTSLYGEYFEYKANSSVVNNSVCAVLHAGGTLGPNGAASATGAVHGSAAVSATGCADWAAWQIGSRTIWNPVKNLDIGVEAMYTAMSKTAFGGATATVAVPLANTVPVGDTHIWSGIVRVQYNFYP